VFCNSTSERKELIPPPALSIPKPVFELLEIVDAVALNVLPNSR